MNKLIYVVVEEVAMHGPIKSVFEGAAVQDPNPLLLRRAPSKVRCRRCHATFCSLLFSLFFHFTSSQLVPGIGKMAKDVTSYHNWTRPSQHWAFSRFLYWAFHLHFQGFSSCTPNFSSCTFKFD